jgi:hypothetical protein
VSDYFGGDSFSSAAPAPIWHEQEPAKGAPWLILAGGLAAVAIVLVVDLLFTPSGDFAALGHAGFWLLSLLAFLVPIAFFSIVDLKRQLVIDYPTRPKTVRTVKTAFLVIGLLASIFQVYQLATELSKLLNVG